MKRRLFVESRVEFLLKSLHNINKISNEEWMASLEERKLKELEFHDSRRKDKNLQEVDSYEKYYGNKKYFQPLPIPTNLLWKT